MNKRGIQLSLNMIIMVILALVFLTLAIVLVQKWMPDNITPPNMCDVYPPTRESPVCAPSEIELYRAKTVKLTVTFYNDEDADINESILPSLICGPNPDGANLEIQTSTAGSFIPVGEISEYMLVIKTPKDTPKGMYPCNLRLSQTQKAIAIVVT